MNSKTDAGSGMAARWLGSVRRIGRGSIVGAALLLVAGVWAGPALAQSADLQVSTYTWTPDPVPNGGTAVFSIRVDNSSGTVAADGATLSVSISSAFEVANAPGTAFPAFCSLAGAFPAAQTLTCPLASLAPSGTRNVDYTATARTVGSPSTIASIAPPPGITDPNALNDSLTRNPTVRTGVNYSVAKTASASTLPASASLSYTLTASNAGPNASAALRVVDNLPPAVDFTFGSATGTNWTCTFSAGGPSVTCDYTGAALAVPATYPPITIAGRIGAALSGTITNSAFTQSTNALVLDNTPANDTSGPVVVTVTPGTDLAASKSMPTTLLTGASANVVLGIQNVGPRSVTAARIVDTFPAGFVLGAMPAGCTAAGQTVTCTSGTLAVGGSQSFTIPVTAPGAAQSGTNVAAVAPPAGFADGQSANDSASVSYTVTPPFADLSLSKSKTPNPVAAGGTLTSTIVVRNEGVAALSFTPAAPLRVTDQFGANERFTGVVTAGWSCTPAAPVSGPATITCSTTGTGTIAVNGTTTLVLQSLPIGIGATPPFPSLANTACTGATAGSLATPADTNAGNDCATANAVGTTRTSDLAIAKEIGGSATGPWGKTFTLTTAANDAFFRLRVSNAGATDTAETVDVTDAIPTYLNDVPFTTAIAVVTTPASTTCAVSGGTVSCRLTALAPGEERTIVVRVSRPMLSGTFTNTATVASPDTIDTSSANDSDGATLTVDPIADVVATQKVVDPDPAQVGVLASYRISFRNAGPNPAANVTLTDTIDVSRFDFIAGSASTTRPGGSCAFASPTVSCTLGTLDRGENFQASFQVRPKFPFAGSPPGAFPVSHTNTATIATTTAQSTTANDSTSVTHDVIAPAVDLIITKTEPVNGDPLIFGDPVRYRIRMQNDGPSRATSVRFEDVAAVPAGYSIAFASFVVDAAASNVVPPAPTCTADTPVVGTVTCALSNVLANSVLDAGEFVTFELTFNATGAAPATTQTYTDTATIRSAESVAGFDVNTANNAATETTTVLPRTDLVVVSKTLLTASPVNVNQPVQYSIVVRNDGPSSTTRVRVTDTLPTGFARTATAITATAAGAASVTSTNCTGTTTIVCDLDGSFPPGVGNTVTLALEARAAFPYTGTVGASVTNGVRIDPGLDPGGNPVSRDPNPANDTGSDAGVTVQASSLAGRVYADDDRSGTFVAGEGLTGVTVTLTGTDIYGNTITATRTTGTNGTYTFANLPPGTYVLTETQPANTFDGPEVAGTSGGTVSGACPPAANCGTGAAQNGITAITLAANTAATGNDFLDYRGAAVRGWVYVDANDDGQRSGAAETGISGTTTPVTLRVTGTDYAGNALTRDVALAADGQYAFTNLPPSDGAGYTVTQLAQPSGFLDGLDQNGAGAGNVVANSAGRTPPEAIVVGAVNPNANLTEHNFGELRPSTLSGRVFVDGNANARRDGGENAGLPGVTVRLTGTNDLGQAIDCTVTTTGAGDYAFPDAGAADATCRTLRPGTYAVAQTPPSGLTVTGAFAGSAGGSGQPANTPLPGAGVTSVTGIVLAQGTTATSYDFGVTGQGLSGSVYVDANGNGVRDPGEAGIAGVTVTLSGTTSGGQDVCTAINPNPCAVVTNASGSYQFLNLPASNGTGYTVTEQSQATPPLSRYTDGTDRAGTVNGATRGTAGNDVVTGVVLALGDLAVDYDFGERAGSLAGAVYVDANDDGVRQGGEPGIPGVTITLSGTTLDGVNVCTLLPSCTVTTAADGSYSFPNLPAGTYTLTQTQPAAYADGRDTAGTVNGGASGTAGGAGTSVISNVVVPPGGTGTDYLFGERVGSLAGRVCIDVANDGCQAGDPGLAGVTITLSGTDAGGAPVSRTATSDATGAWQFLDLPLVNGAGWTVAETQPAGYASTVTNTTAGTAGGVVANDAVTGIALPPGGAATGYAFGELRADLSITKNVTPTRVKIGDLVTFDVALANAGPTLAPGVVVADPLPSGLQFVSAAAAPGTYDATTGAWTIGAVAVGATPTLAITARVRATGSYVNVAQVAASGAPDPDSTAGNDVAGEDDRGTATITPLASVTGSVWQDLDGDGVRDPGETPYVGVTVTITDSTGNVQTVTTDANGDYAADVAPGATTLDVAAPPGTRLTTANDPQTVTVASSATPTPSPPVGYQPLGQIAGIVFSDLNGNAIRDPGEPVLPNVPVVVTLPTGGTASGTTDANGGYSIQVPAGSNSPNVTDPPGTTLTTANDPQTVIVPPGGTGTATPVGFRPPGPDLILSKTHTPATFTESNVGTYSLVVRNVGADPTSGTYTVVDSLPDGLTVAAVPTGTGWTCGTTTLGSRTATCTASDVLAPGTAAPAITLRVNVAAGASANSPLVNVASVSGGGELPANSGNDSASDPTPVQRAATLSGSVWLDVGATLRQRDGGDAGLAGWTVELIDPSLPAGSAPVRTATTDANGQYQIVGVTPGTYRLQFRDPVSGIVYGTPVNGEQGTAQPGSQPFPGNERGALQVTLAPGTSLPQQSLPVDPSGVVYDAVSREPVPGAIVTLRPRGTCAAWDPARDVVNATLGGYTVGNGGVSMTTGANGWYVFKFATTAPASCTFEYVVTPPASYVAPSALIPASAPFVAPSGSGVVPVQPQATAPRVGQGTTYHLVLTLGSSLATVVRNHIPLDPAVASSIVIEKVASSSTVEFGDSLGYTIRVRNVRGPTLPVVTIDDRLPAGFRYIDGTARVRIDAGTVARLADPAGRPGPRLAFAYDGALRAGSVLELTYRVRVGVGSLQGDGINRARAISGVVGSNLAEARVRVTGGAFATDACVVGKIYADCDENRVQDPEEPGIPGVRFYFEDGTWLVSDSEGKYSLCGLTPKTHVLKVDPTTVPRGASLDTVDNRNAGDPDSRFVDLRNGELHRADFAVRGCPADVKSQIAARRTQGEVQAPELERAAKPTLSLDPERETQCRTPRYANDPAYRGPADECSVNSRKEGRP